MVYVVISLGVWFIYEHGYEFALEIEDMKNRGETTRKCIIKLNAWDPEYKYAFIEPINE